MEVVASEPLVASPSAVCWDERGRMVVSELHGYNFAGQLDIEELNDKVVSSAPNPADGSPGHGYCLDDPGQSYVVFSH